jgi:GNAT superfamily N-acetyltransferase
MLSIQIREATLADIPVIQSLAEKTWRPTYDSILTEEQTLYMLDWMYSDESLYKQFMTNTFLLLESAKVPVGFVAFERKNDSILKIHKIYLLPEMQGKGLGKVLLNEVVLRATKWQYELIELNVNRTNVAVKFYQNYGFAIVEEVDIEIGNDFWMNDYVMQLPIEPITQKLEVDGLD